MSNMDLLCGECKEKITAALNERFSHLDGMNKFKAMKILVNATNEIHTIYYDNACDVCKHKLMVAARK